jgi:signal transduction histidine kinase
LGGDYDLRLTVHGQTIVGTVDGQEVVRVEDTGIGLGGEDGERLFQRLYRGRRARELRPSGTGLGLAIARWIVEAHGGRIELADRPGGGTVATVALPLRAK